MKEIYVDGSCQHQYGQGSWAVVMNDGEYSGKLYKEDIDAPYCELFALKQALLITQGCIENIVIYTDNDGIYTTLHKTEEKFEQRLKKRGKRAIKNKDIFSTVYKLYHSSYRVIIKRIPRILNEAADSLAKKTLKSD